MFDGLNVRLSGREDPNVMAEPRKFIFNRDENTKLQSG